MRHRQYAQVSGGNRGFTLFELSIVLIIIAIVTGMAVTTGVSVVATARLSATQKKMKAIEDALMQYRAAWDRLPCPGDLTLTQGNATYGVEAANPGSCTGGAPTANFTSGAGAEGAVPTATLGLPADFMYDGWGNRFRYAVDTAMTAAGIFSATPVGASCGPITVNDANGNARSTKALYALISHGPNGHGAYTANGVTVNAGSVNANELTNCHCDSTGAATAYSPTYVQMNPSQDPANALNSFDDLVTYKERWQMQTAWDTVGTTANPLNVVAATYYDGGYDPIYFYTIDPCGGVTGTMVTPGVYIYGLAYSHDNSLLYLPRAYSNGYIFNVNASGIATTDTGVAIPNPDGGGHSGPVVSPDGQYFVMTTGGAATTPIYKTTAGPTITTLAGVNLGSYSLRSYNNVSFDPSVTHMAVGLSGDSPAAPNPTIFKRSGDTFTALVGQPDQSFPSSYPYTATQVAFSYDGAYLYAACDTCGGNLFRIYAVSGDTYTQVAGQPDVQPLSPEGIAVSPNDTYVAISNPYYGAGVRVYKRVGGTFTYLSGAFSGTPPAGNLLFTKDSKYLVSLIYVSPYINVYKVNPATDTFTLLPAPTLIPPQYFGWYDITH